MELANAIKYIIYGGGGDGGGSAGLYKYSFGV